MNGGSLVNSNQPLNLTRSDEIDLIELFQSLWAQKWLISGAAAVVAAAAGAYAFGSHSRAGGSAGCPTNETQKPEKTADYGDWFDTWRCIRRFRCSNTQPAC